MSNAIVEKFKKMGAEAKIVYMPLEERVHFKPWRQPARWITRQLSPAPLALDIKNVKGKEVFEIRISEAVKDTLDLQVLEVVPEERHLVLFAKLQQTVRSSSFSNRTGMRVVSNKMHFLCGHDERHWFVAGVSPCSTVRDAKYALKPRAIDLAEAKAGVRYRDSNKRHNEAFVRQGEWFFVPTPGLEVNEHTVRKDEPLSRGRGSKNHVCQFACRTGGEEVWVKYNGKGQADITRTKESYEKLSDDERREYTQMMKNPQLYVKGTVKHADHATIDLGEVWHRVYMNNEKHELRGRTVAFLD